MDVNIQIPNQGATLANVSTAVALVASLSLPTCESDREQTPLGTPAPPPLRRADSFARITDPPDRSRRLFLEASQVLRHPRCANCHPGDDLPRQGDHQRVHDPRIARTPDAGATCRVCHRKTNRDDTGIPGAPEWALAPREAGWLDRDAASICQQLKDPSRNGGRSLAELVEHAEHDELVAWGWAPGRERQPAPGNQQQFAELLAAWAATGAWCPE